MNFAKVRKNQEKENDKLHQERLERCIPVAREISSIIEKAQLPLGDDVQHAKEYEKASIAVLELLLERNVRWVDREFIFQLALQPVTFVKDIVTTSLQNSWTHTVAGLFGKKTSELTMSEVDNALRKAPEEEVENIEETTG